MLLDATVTAGASYSYRVLAYNLVGSSDFSSTVSVTTPPPVVVPTPTVSQIAPTAMTTNTGNQPLTVQGSNFQSGNIVQFKWGVGVGAGVWNTGNTPVIASPSALTVSMNPGPVPDVINVRVCRSAAQTATTDCSSGTHAVTVTR